MQSQHINTTDSAVRITHLKYNIVVQSQSERSQHRNRDTAMKMLKSRIYEIELDKKMKRRKRKKVIKNRSVGGQIRSYVLHPIKWSKISELIIRLQMQKMFLMGIYLTLSQH